MDIKGIKIVILLSYICIASISAAIITPALPQIEQQFNLGHGALEWIISVFLCGYVVGQLLYGPLANRYGRLNALRIGLVINLLGILLCLYSVYINSYVMLLFGRFISALGSASGLVCTFILINELLSPSKVKVVMPFTTVSFTIGIGLAVVVGGVVTQYLDWTYCFWVLLLHGVLMLLFTWLYPETLKQPKPLNVETIFNGYSNALSSKTLVIYSVILSLVAVCTYCYSAAAPIYSHNQLHLLSSQYGYWNVLSMAGMLGSGFLSSYLMKKYGAEHSLFIGFVFIGGCLLSLGLLTYASVIDDFNNALWFFLTTAGLYLFTGLLYPGASYIASNAIEDKASASSMMSFINIFIAMLSVVVLGYLPVSSVLALFLVFSFVYIVGFFLLLRSR